MWMVFHFDDPFATKKMLKTSLQTSHFLDINRMQRSLTPCACLPHLELRPPASRAKLGGSSPKVVAPHCALSVLHSMAPSAPPGSDWLPQWRDAISESEEPTAKWLHMEISWVRESSGWEGSNVHARFTVALQWPPSWIMHSSRKGMDLAGCSSCWKKNAARNLLIGVSQAACELQLLCRMHESWGSVWPSNSYKPETKF